jgi:membrane-bound ClpP family serine protease
MLEVPLLLGLVAFFAFVVFSFSADLAWLVGKLIEPIVRIFQKKALGIDAPRAGTETMIGKRAAIDGYSQRTSSDGEAECFVRIDGERWRAKLVGATPRSKHGLPIVVKVVGRDGLVLRVQADIDNE